MSTHNIIQPGIEKLEDYQAAIADILTYTLATCKFLIFFFLEYILTIIIVLNPSINLNLLIESKYKLVSEAKTTLYKAVSLINPSKYNISY